MIHSLIHLGLHFLVPFWVARVFFKDRWWQVWVIMMLTMIIDLDHLFANPIYDPDRCSINFHPLHTYPAVGIYCLMVAIPKLRLVGLGFLIHMALDGVDCIWISYA
jgi:hypothetical protein